MNNLETLKNELINQKNLLESKNYSVTTASTYPSPSEITASMQTLLENVPEVSTYATLYKIFADPTTFNTIISDLVIPEGTTNLRDYFAARLGENLIGNVTLPESVIVIGDRAFAETNITECIFPQNLTSIGSYAFYKCPNLQRIIIPDSVTTLGSYSYHMTNDFTELRLSENLTELTNSAFRIANLLTSVTIPAKITKINTNNFFTVPLLENFYLKGNNVTFSSSSIFGTHNDKLKIWVNFDAIATYYSMTNLTKAKDHLISEVTISELNFPTTSVALNWYATIDDATTGANVLTSPSSIGTYYCKVA